MKTDEQLQLDVIAELKWEPSVNASRIGVEVEDGIVTLAGHVNSYAEKWDAERATQRVSGVKALTVEMAVDLSESDRRTDAEIARLAENVLQWATYLPKESIKIMVENGLITLSGVVDWEYQKQAAISAVSYLQGVTDVKDQMNIKPCLSSHTVSIDIEAALKRHGNLAIHNILVTADGSAVTLTGMVHSWLDHDLAMSTAWSALGVQSVQDDITVAY